MKQKLLISLFLVLSILVNAQTSLKQINLTHGTYSVGFDHYLTSDNTRTYKRVNDWNNQYIDRPIRISIWYPSEEKIISQKPLLVSDYMEVLKLEEEWEHLPNELILDWFYYLGNTPEFRAHLKEKTSTYRNIKPADEKFPVIVYTPSYQASSIENFAICEYLASHGYVVISSPSRGYESRRLQGGTAKDMETQARDVEFLITELLKLNYVDSDKIATMGFSFGGLSHVLSQMRNKKIKAILSLDGSIKYQYETLKTSPFFNMENVDVPFIHMAQKNIPDKVLKEDKINPELNNKFIFFDSLTNSKAYKLKFNNLTHSYFSSFGIFFQPRDKRQDKSDAEIMESYNLVSIYALNFLNAFLKDDKKALKFMESTPKENNIKDGVITFEGKKNPKTKSFTFQDFNELASKQDYNNLEELYQNILLEYPDLKLQEGTLNSLGLQLLFNPKTSQKAIKVFLLAIKIYPNSANLFDSLAEGYMTLGDKENAIQHFKKSLELNPQNQNAINRLKQLND